MTKNIASAPAAGTTAEIAFARSDLGVRLLALKHSGPASSHGLAEFILRHSVRVTAIGITELAASCAVSVATVSRFARALGFGSYSAMRSAIAEALGAGLDPIEKLRGSIERATGAASPGTDSLDYALANIDATRQGVSATEFDEVVGKIAHADTVYVMGFGLSSHVAGILALHLQPFCRSVVEVVAYGGTEAAAGRLMNIGPKDVLVAISFPRYAADAVKLSAFAKQRGAWIVTLTDSLAAPLAMLADRALLAKSAHPILPSSSTAAIALIEAVVAALMVASKHNLEKASELSAAIAPYLVDATSQPR